MRPRTVRAPSPFASSVQLYTGTSTGVLVPVPVPVLVPVPVPVPVPEPVPDSRSQYRNRGAACRCRYCHAAPLPAPLVPVPVPVLSILPQAATVSRAGRPITHRGRHRGPGYKRGYNLPLVLYNVGYVGPRGFKNTHTHAHGATGGRARAHTHRTYLTGYRYRSTAPNVAHSCHPLM